MNGRVFRAEIAPRVPAWVDVLPRLDAAMASTPDLEILLRPQDGLSPFRAEMLLEMVCWSGNMLVVVPVVGGPEHFGSRLHLNSTFLSLFRPYIQHPTEILRSCPL